MRKRFRSSSFTPPGFSTRAVRTQASNRKYVLEKVTQSKVQALIDGSSRASGLSKPDRTEIARLLCDPGYEVGQAPESPDGKGLERTGSNFYEKGITGPEVMAVLDKTLKPNINSRVIRSDKGLACETLTTQSPGVVGAALQKVVAHLQAARPMRCRLTRRNRSRP